MKDYVLGFAFDRRGAVALILKGRPDWQAGKWNGIGGHRNPKEDGAAAMVREFYEETDMRTSIEQWRLAGQLKKCGDYRCLVYTTHVPDLRVHTNTDEAIKVFTRQEQALMLGTFDYPCLANVESMIIMCNMVPDREAAIPFFTLDYTKNVGRKYE